jgi:hypothetical protein
MQHHLVWSVSTGISKELVISTLRVSIKQARGYYNPKHHSLELIISHTADPDTENSEFERD